MNNKRKPYIKMDREIERNKIYALLDKVESDKEDDIGNLLNNLDMEFEFEKNLENDVVPDKQSSDVLIPDANIHLVADAESELNDKVNNAQLDQEITKKRKSKESERYAV